MRIRPTLGLSLLVLAVLAAHGRGLFNGFAYDDEPIVAQNPIVSEGGLAEAWSEPYWSLDDGTGVLWRPVTTAAFQLQWKLGDGDPFLFHLTNLLLALATAVLVVLLLQRLIPPDQRYGFEGGDGFSLPAVTGGLLFAVHPVHVEAVANVVGQGELWAALFFLTALNVGLHRPDHPQVRALRSAALVLLYIGALGSKEIGVTLPVVLICLRWMKSGDLRGVLREEAPTLLAMAAALSTYLVLRGWVLGGIVGEDPAPLFRGVGEAGRIWTALSVVPLVWGLLLAPIRLSADYDPGHVPVVEFGGLGGWIGLGVWAAILGIALLLVRRGGGGRWIGGGILLAELIRLPIANLVLPTGVILAERTLFLPSLGIALAAAGGLALADLRPRRAFALMVAVVGLLSVRSAVRTPVWTSTFTAMASLGRDAPSSWRALRTLAVGRLNSGDAVGGLEAMEVAWRTLPYRYDLSAELATQLRDAGRRDEARGVYRWTLEHWPDRVDGYNLFAELELLTGDYMAAHRLAGVALRYTGGNARTWGVVSESWLGRGRLREALIARETSVALDPSDLGSRSRLAEIEGLMGQLDVEPSSSEPGSGGGR